MFRNKDRLMKWKNENKYKNCNKEIKNPIEIKYWNDTKINQLILRKNYDIKIQKNDLRSLSSCNNENTLIGNSNVKDVRLALDDITKNVKIPYDVNHKHDMTKWKMNKEKQNLRKKQRDDKICSY